ncbi:hypothetical protein GGF46_003468 [Coemansia sp. RSA 552]|nr:hypothetical protein GGF46_003468 [Coemansia sp. RSA 552]
MQVISVSNQKELDEILSNHDKVAVDFNAGWCGSCKAMRPVFEGLSKKHEDVAFLSVDIDEADDLAKEYGIRSMPTFKLIDHGKVVDEIVGANKKELEDGMDSFTNDR